MVEPEQANKEIPVEIPGVELETSRPVAAVVMSKEEESFLMGAAVAAPNMNL